MPFVSHRGQNIHYTVEGSGPLVVLQHGLFLDAQSWKRTGFVDALVERYQVACVDSLGHGLSDKAADPALYAQDQRAGDLVAVIDDLGVDRAHLVGHSMGGWMGVGMAKHHPRRLASLTVGGWDLVNGVASALPPQVIGPVPYDQMMIGARRVFPDLVKWVTPEVEPGLRACWDALNDLAGAAEAVLTLDAPVMLWNGRDDPYHDPMQVFAATHGLKFVSTQGDHLGMVFDHGAEGARGIRTFLETI